MVNDREIEVLINDVFEYHGFDFSGYSRASFKRRVYRLMQLDGFKEFTAFLSKVRTDAVYFKHMIEEITVSNRDVSRPPFLQCTAQRDTAPAGHKAVYTYMACRLRHRRRGVLYGYFIAGGKPFAQIADVCYRY